MHFLFKYFVYDNNNFADKDVPKIMNNFDQQKKNTLS